MRVFSELRLFLIILAAAVLLPLIFHLYGAWQLGHLTDLMAGAQVLWAEFFRVLSFLTTTGFDSSYTNRSVAWSGVAAPTVILIGLVTVGGAAASTAGGVRLRSLVVLLNHGHSQIRKIGVPEKVQLFEPDTVGDDELRRAWLTAMLYSLTVAGGMLAVAAFGLDFEAAMVSAIASLSNAGPLYPLLQNDNLAWAKTNDPQKLAFCLLMICGRVGLLAVISALRR